MDIDTGLPPVSPKVVAAIMISQNTKVTCGARSGPFQSMHPFRSPEDVFCKVAHISKDDRRRMVAGASQRIWESHVIHRSARSVVFMDTERGTILRIDARGRITVQLRDRVVLADLHSGGGGCVGDVVEGRMLSGVHSWRNVGNNIVCVVHVLSTDNNQREPRNGRPGISQQAFPPD